MKEFHGSHHSQGRSASSCSRHNNPVFSRMFGTWQTCSHEYLICFSGWPFDQAKTCFVKHQPQNVGQFPVHSLILIGSFLSSSSKAVTMQFVSHCFLDYHDPTIGKWLGGALIIFLGGGVLPCPKTPYSISDQNIRFSVPYFRLDSQNVYYLFQTMWSVAISATLNRIYGIWDFVTPQTMFFLRDTMSAAICYC